MHLIKYLVKHVCFVHAEYKTNAGGDVSQGLAFEQPRPVSRYNFFQGGFEFLLLFFSFNASAVRSAQACPGSSAKFGNCWWRSFFFLCSRVKDAAEVAMRISISSITVVSCVVCVREKNNIQMRFWQARESADPTAT